MSQTIDSKVVEMKFNNDDFEKNVAESLRTLDELRNRLENLEKQDVHFDKLSDAVDSFDLSKVDKSLDAITHRFSTMGQIGASVLHNLTTDAYNLAKSFGSKMWNTTFGQIKAGGKSRAANIEQSKFLLEGMGIAFSDEVDKAINDAVTDTAYGYDEAAMAMAQLSGASVKLGDDMNQALKAISGVAAMTNRSFSDIADIFVDAAAYGKVSADAFSRLGERGLAAKSIMQDFYGVTSEELDKLAKKGAISFNDFTKAMYDAFGTQAKKSNETLNGVLANTRAALSKIGQSFYQPLMANNSDLVKMLQSLKDRLNELRKYTNPLAESMSNYVLKLSRWGKGVLDSLDLSKTKPFFDNLVTIFENITKAAENLYTNILKPFGNQFKAALYEVFPSLNTGKGLIITLSDKLVELTKRFRNFTAETGLFGKKGEALKEVLKGILTLIKAAASILKFVGSVLLSVIGLIGKFTGGLSGAIVGISDFVRYASTVGYWLIVGIGNGLIYGISALMGVITNVAHMIIDGFCKVLGIHSPSTEARDQIGKQIIAGIAEGLLYGLSVVSSAIQTAVSWILENVVGVLSKIFTSVSDVVVKAFAAAFDVLSRVLDAFIGVVNKADTAKLKEILTGISQFAIVAAQLLILFQVTKAVTGFGMAAWNFGVAAKRLATSIELITATELVRRIGITIGNIANIFKGLALTIAAFSASMIIFATMIKNGYLDELALSMSMLLIVVYMIGMIVKRVASLEGEQLRSAGLAFIGFGLSLWAFANGVRKLGSMSWPEITAAVWSIGLVVGILAALAKAMSDGEGWYSQINFKLILAFAAGVWLLAGSIRRIGKTPLPEVLQGSAVIAGLIAFFGLFSILLVKMSKLQSGDLSEGHFMSLALAFLAFGVTVKMLAKTIVTLGFIKQEHLSQGMLVVSTIMALITAVMLAAHFVAAEASRFLATVAILMISLATSVKILGEMRGDISQGLAVLGAIFVEIGAFTFALNKIKPNLGSLTSLAFVSAMILAMTGVIKVLGEMDFNDLLQGAGSLVVLLGIFTGIIALWSKLNKKMDSVDKVILNVNSKNKKNTFFGGKEGKERQRAFKERITYIKTIVRSLSELSLVMAAVSRVMQTPEDAVKAIVVMAGSLVVLMVAISQMSKVGSDKDKSLKGMASAIRAIAGVMLVIGGDLILLSQMPTAGLITAGAVIAVILGVIALLIHQAKTFSDYESLNPKPIQAAAMVILAIGAAMSAMIFVAKDADPLLVAAIGAGLGVAIFAIYKAVEQIGKIKMDLKSGFAVLAAVSSLLVVAGAIAIISMFKWEDYGIGLIAAASCIAILVTVAALIGKFAGAGNTVVAAAAMAIVAGSMVLAAAAIAILAQFKWQDYIGGLIAMSVALGVLTAIAGIVAYFTAGVGVIAGAVAMAIVAGAMVIAAASIAILAQFKWQDYIGGLIAMSVALGLLSAVAALIGFFSVGYGALTGAVAMAIVAGAMCIAAASVAILAQFDWDQIGQSLIAMSVALGALTIVAGIMGAIGGGKAALMGAAAMAAVAGAVLILAFAFESFANTVTNYFTPEHAQNVVTYFQTINEAIPGLAESLMVNLEAAVAAIREHVPVLKEEISGLVDALADSMTELAEQIKVRGQEVVNAIGDMVDGIKETIEERFGIHSPSKYMADIGVNLMLGLVEGIKQMVKAPIDMVKNAGTWIIDKFKDVLGVHSPSTIFYEIGKWLFPGLVNAMSDTAPMLFTAAEDAGSDLVTSFKSGAADLLNGNLSGSIGDALNNLFSNLDIDKLKSGDFSGLLSGLVENGISLDSLGGDSLTAFIDKLKEAGIAGDGLTDILKTLGISIDDLGDSDLAESLGLEEAKEGAEDLKTSIQDLADEIIKGKFGNAPERWDKMFEHLINAGLTAQEAYAAIAEAQNEVNKRLGNSVVHSADEMEKKVSDTAKKANATKAEANKKQEPRDFTKDPYKAKPETVQDKARAASAAEEQMKNNMPYENYKAIKAGQVTKEYEKQTIEAYKQKLANEHIYSLKEKENAMAALTANEQRLANAGVSDETRKQIEAENQRYKKVIDTYNTQQDMIKAINEQESATKKAEAAEKKRGDTVKASSGAVVYGTDEYYKQTAKTGKTINTVAAKPQQQPTTVETKPVQTETKVEVTPKFEIKEVDTTALKETLTKTVETEMKSVKAVAEIKPKIDMMDAQKAVQGFQTTVSGMKKDISDSFSGIAEEVAKHVGKIASTFIDEGSKISTNAKTAFQNAVSSAINILNAKDTINKFYNAGKNATQGYAKGMRDKGALSAVRSAGATIGNTSAKAVKTAIKSNSPSKVFIGIGEFAGIGYGNGIANTISYVSDASEKMADASVDQLFGAVNAIQSAVEEGIDLSPTVVPVIDASQIQNGLSSINSAMDTSRYDIASITANMSAKASYDNSQVEEMRARMDGMTNAFNDLATIMSNQPEPVVNANVNLMGDADGVFKLVQQSNSRYTKMHGKSAFA